MAIGRRPVSVFLNRLTEPHSYRALGRMFKVHEHPLAVVFREVFSQGGYPITLNVHTPLGKRPVHLFHPEDLSTLDSVFCRLDYADPRPLDTVVDFGSNIGITGLYWLTRSPNTRAYLFEPVPRNFERLQLNLEGLEDRYKAQQVALSDSRGTISFGVEDAGRSGGIGVDTGRSIEVQRIHVMDALEPILRERGTIDCFKVDIEGHEIEVFSAIPDDAWKRIRYLAVEDHLEHTRAIVPEYFTHTKQIAVMRYTNTLMNGR